MSDSKKREVCWLRDRLRRWGFDLSGDQIASLGVFLDELEEWNEKTNLIGLSSRRRIVNELLFDSILPVPFLPEEGTLLDVGSGAGFPAIPIKICKPRLTCKLMEPKSKKIHFLKQVIRLTRLQDIEVIQDRLPPSRGIPVHGAYDIITSRGVYPLPELLDLCIPYLGPGGRMVAFLGRERASTIEESAGILQRDGLTLERRIGYTVSGRASDREILILGRRGFN